MSFATIVCNANLENNNDWNLAPILCLQVHARNIDGGALSSHLLHTGVSNAVVRTILMLHFIHFN